MSKTRYVISLPDSVIEVLNENEPFEKGIGYIHDGYVYIYRGKIKKGKDLKPASVYTDNNGKAVWVEAGEDDKDQYSETLVLPFNTDEIFQTIKDRANLKDVDHRLADSAEDAFVVDFNENDDVLKHLIKEVLMAMRVVIKPAKDSNLKNEISNLKSNLGKENAKLSISYFLKWVKVLDLDAKISITFTNAEGKEQTLTQILR